MPVLKRISSLPDTVEVGPAAGSALTAVLAAISWISGYQFLSGALAATAGSLLTFYLASLQQRRIWRRDIAIRSTTELYGPLYVDIWNALQAFSKEGRVQNSVVIDRFTSELWPKIVGDYRYRVLPKDLRNQLDDFYDLVKRTSLQWDELFRLGNRIVLEQTSKAVQKSITLLDWVVRCTKLAQPPYEQVFSLSTALAGGENIMSYVRRQYPGVDSYFFFMQAEYAGGPERNNMPIDQAKVEGIFAEMEVAFTANKIAKEHQESVEKIRSAGATLREHIGLIVEEPWKS